MSFDDLQLNGRVAVVTGGSRGIGRGIAELLSERGASLAVAYREREAAAQALVEALRARGGVAWAGRCNVADESTVKAFFTAVEGELGRVDILVNNAGMTRGAHFMLMDSARWSQVRRTPS